MYFIPIFFCHGGENEPLELEELDVQICKVLFGPLNRRESSPNSLYLRKRTVGPTEHRQITSHKVGRIHIEHGILSGNNCFHRIRYILQEGKKVICMYPEVMSMNSHICQALFRILNPSTNSDTLH